MLEYDLDIVNKAQRANTSHMAMAFHGKLKLQIHLPYIVCDYGKKLDTRSLLPNKSFLPLEKQVQPINNLSLKTVNIKQWARREKETTGWRKGCSTTVLRVLLMKVFKLYQQKIKIIFVNTILEWQSRDQQKKLIKFNI